MVANLSRFVQYVELDLSRFAGRRPVEMFGQTQFPTIGKTPYLLTLSPHAFYWFALEAETEAPLLGPRRAAADSTWTANNSWQDLLQGRTKKTVRVLAAPRAARAPLVWRHRAIDSSLVRSTTRSRSTAGRNRAHHADLDSAGRVPRRRARRLPAAAGRRLGPEADELTATGRQPVVASCRTRDLEQPACCTTPRSIAAASTALVELMVHRRRLKGSHGELVGWSTPDLADIAESVTDVRPTLVRSEQRTNSMAFGDQADPQIVSPHRKRHQSRPRDRPVSQSPPRGVSAYAAIGRRRGVSPRRGGPATVGVLHEYVPNTVAAWQFVQDALGRYFEEVMAQPVEARPVAATAAHASLWELAGGDAPALAKDLLGGLLEWAALLGRRTGEMHATLASERSNPAFAPEPFSQFHQRSLYQSSRKLALQTFQQLRGRLKTLSPEVQALAREVLDREKMVLEKFRGRRRPEDHGPPHSLPWRLSLGSRAVHGQGFSDRRFRG